MTTNDQGELIKSRVIDIYSICHKRNIPKYSFFLNEREAYLASITLRSINAIGYSFYGGHEDSERAVLGVFPSYMEPSPENFPVTPISFSFRKQFPLNHRDFLGSLMSLRLNRDTIGDILVGEGFAVVFAYETVASTIIDGISKIGNVGVEPTLGLAQKLPSQKELIEITGTVASPRLDSIVKLCTGKSRDEAVKLIEAGLVILNHTECTNSAKHVCPDDKFTIRGFGRFILSGIGTLTRKGRVHVIIGKYI